VNYYAERAKRLGLEYAAMESGDALATGAAKHPASEREILQSQAISLKRIADIMEKDREPTIERAEDIERDPLMIIARAMEEIAKPTLPQESPLHATAEREAQAIEEIRDMLRKVTRDGDAVRQIRR
jgi:hypothetical protein